jgi:hypothetical protein
MNTLEISWPTTPCAKRVPKARPPPELEMKSPRKRRKKMPFEKEMDQFFIRNCYTEPERERVRACPAYQLAALKDDMIEAQEIATRVVEVR